MAVAIRAVGAVAYGVGAIAPGLPAGTAADDILVMFLETYDQAITVSGWTQAGNSPQSLTTDTRLTVFWKRAVGGDATTTSDSGNHQIGRIIGFTGCTTTGNPFNVTAGGTGDGADNQGSIPGAVTDVTDTMVIAACCSGYDMGSDGTAFFSSWTNANLGSLTEQIDNFTTANNGGAIGVATGTWATTGDYGATTVSLATSTTQGLWSGALMAPQPPRVSDTITVTDTPAISGIPNPSTSQAITVTDTPQVNGLTNPNVTQAVTVYDGAQYYSDGIFVTESLTVSIETPPATSNSNFFLMFD